MRILQFQASRLGLGVLSASKDLGLIREVLTDLICIGFCCKRIFHFSRTLFFKLVNEELA